MHAAERFKINRPKVIAELFDDEVVVINFDTGSYYSLTSAAADIWTSLAAGAAIGEIADAVAARYTASRTEIEAAIESLVAELSAENLIVADAEKKNGAVAVQTAGSAAEKRCFDFPRLEKYTDMQELILLDPIHEVDEAGWPNGKRPGGKSG